MRNDLTDITMVVDRSGSMSKILDDAQGGVNNFVKEQANASGKANLTIVEFDTEYEFVCNGISINEAKEYKLVPRGMTALYDAVGRAIYETGSRLEKIPEDQRPGFVVFVIVTDGYENSSKEFSSDKVKELIEHQKEKYSWHFEFLAANQDAFAAGGAIGIKNANAADFDASKIQTAYSAASNKLLRARSAVASNASKDQVEAALCYTADERKSMKS